MSRFLTPLRSELVDDSDDVWILLAALVFLSDVLGREIVVPEGFKTNFASVRRLPLAYWLFGGIARSASAVHDYLYSLGEVPREVADRVFLEAMEASRVPAWRRWPMYWAVRVFGGPHYGPVARATT